MLSDCHELLIAWRPLEKIGLSLPKIVYEVRRYAYAMRKRAHLQAVGAGTSERGFEAPTKIAMAAVEAGTRLDSGLLFMTA